MIIFPSAKSSKLLRANGAHDVRASNQSENALALPGQLHVQPDTQQLLRGLADLMNGRNQNARDPIDLQFYNNNSRAMPMRGHMRRCRTVVSGDAHGCGHGHVAVDQGSHERVHRESRDHVGSTMGDSIDAVTDSPGTRWK